MNDMLPEEQDPEFEELITLLRHADLNPPLIDPTERAQILSQARARLFPADSEASQPKHMPMNEMQSPGSLPSRPKARSGKRGRLVHLLNMLAAVLVVALLIGSTLLILGPLRQDLSGTAPPVGAPVIMFFGSSGGALLKEVTITPGPYFLGELLEVDLSITNRSHTTYLLRASKGPSCPGFLNITTTDGGSPHTTDMQRNWSGLPMVLLNCNWPLTAGPPQGFD